MLAPGQFHGRNALHLIRPTWSLESTVVEKLAADIAAAQETLKGNNFIVLANTNLEVLLLSSLGVPVIQTSALMFIDEQVFRPQPPGNSTGIEFAAVYLARLDKYKRHELARNIESLLLIYDYTLDESRDSYAILKQLIPGSRFLNHELGKGSFIRLSPDIVSRYLSKCRVGLCLSELEGMTKASMEYLLCGLPVVSVPNVGGRDRFLMPPYSIETEDNPEAIAFAVQELINRNINQKVLRDHTLHLLRFERHNFLLELNKIVKKLMGIDPGFDSCAPFINAQRGFLPASHLVKNIVTGIAAR
jgi:glycosyltransferase involved in cell wall biosynthesis